MNFPLQRYYLLGRVEPVSRYIYEQNIEGARSFFSGAGLEHAPFGMVRTESGARSKFRGAPNALVTSIVIPSRILSSVNKSLYF